MVKYMDLQEFREEGYVQEVNRKFFHPLGLALEIEVDDEEKVVKFGGIWDCRDDPEGLFYPEDLINEDNATRIEAIRLSKIDKRVNSEFDTDTEGIQIK